MSTREQIDLLLDKVPAYRMNCILAYIQGVTDDEAEDDRICEQMYQDYLNDPDPEKDELVSEEEAARMLGIAL